ncbi:MAG TPA: uracil-DNA glycosylase family protein [Methylophilaceae bacterium]|nr:uracil-DNA glycosylase family protein [Methylophilaceae bacterium]
MSLTREDMLRELELLPVWKLREQPQATDTAPQPHPSAEAQAVATTSLPPQPIEMQATVVPSPAVPSSAEMPIVENPMVTQPLAQAVPLGMPAMVAEQPDAPWDETPVSDDSLAVEEALPPLTTSPGEDRRERIMKLDWAGLQACVPDCQACGLAGTRTQTVFGVGDPQAEWLIVGEAPGAEEDKRGEPFVGQAGKLLDNMLAAIKLKRGENVYIANVLKCRPPENRDPHGEEVAQCDPFLKRQVELIQPKLILALGKFAAQSLLGSDDTIGAMRGKLHRYNGVPVIVTYHPAYLLRNLMDKAKAWEDLCFAVKTMQTLQAEALQSATQPPPSH